MRLNLSIQLIAMVAAALVTSGCATIFNSGPPKLDIITVPPGAKIDIGEGLATCTSPCIISAPIQSSLPLTASLDNYLTYQGTIKRTVAYSFYFNVALSWFGLIGMAIDFGTDSIWKWESLDPIALSPKSQPKNEPEPIAEAKPEPIDSDKGAPSQVAPPVSDLPTSTTPKKANLEPGSVRTKYPEAIVKRRIEWFFGPQSESSLIQHTECVYGILEGHEGGASLSLDDAVKMGNSEKIGRCKIED